MLLLPFSHPHRSLLLTIDAQFQLVLPYTSDQQPSHCISMSTSYYQYPAGSLPVNVPGKAPQSPYVSRHARSSSAYSQLSASPPERPESVSSTGAGLYSSASSAYGGSDYDSSSGATSVDLLDYMNDRLSQAYNPIPLDKNLARQAQM